jgi:hypothetical protein
METSVLATLLGSKTMEDPITIKIEAIGENRPVAIASSNITIMSRKLMASSSREIPISQKSFRKFLE